MKQLSISIVAYDNYNDIKNAILSIERYTTVSKVIYVFDNGVGVSLKDDISSFKQFIKEYNDVEYIDCQSNLGFGAGHNKALPLVSSEYHAIVNPDIIIEEDVFSSIIEYMNANSDIGMIIPNITNENGERQLAYRKELTVFDMFVRMFCSGLFKKRQAEHTLQNQDYSKPFQVPFGQGCFFVVRTELFQRLKGFDEGYFMYLEDADLCKRVNKESKLMYYPEATVIHKWGKGSHKDKTLFKYHVKSMMYYFKKWGWKIF